ncbi:hypothetical protein KM043_008613 [Ampulex compressa]|nr:hypothetical protein KM043_008613 [Ampulex compressa]
MTRRRYDFTLKSASPMHSGSDEIHDASEGVEERKVRGISSRRREVAEEGRRGGRAVSPTDQKLNASRYELRLECNREDCRGTTPRISGPGGLRGEGMARRFWQIHIGDARGFCALLPQ